MNKPVKFDNSKATNDQRAAHMEAKDAYVENHGDDDEPNWMLFYKGTDGRDKSLSLDAQTWEDAIFQACETI